MSIYMVDYFYTFFMDEVSGFGMVPLLLRWLK
jgi:hypothetical protein